MQTPLFPFHYSRAPIYRPPIYRLPRIYRAFFLYPEYKLHVKINENSTPMYCSPLTVYSSFPPKLHGKWGYEGIWFLFLFFTKNIILNKKWLTLQNLKIPRRKLKNLRIKKLKSWHCKFQIWGNRFFSLILSVETSTVSSFLVLFFMFLFYFICLLKNHCYMYKINQNWIQNQNQEYWFE